MLLKNIEHSLSEEVVDDAVIRHVKHRSQYVISAD